jgi:hypothetical protein
VLDRLGVGYERMREVNPGVVYCAISGYGQDGPKRNASGHDMNYLGLVGLLGLTGERSGVGGHGVGGHPIQAAGQIADLGGGALMAAFGILAALRERDGGPRGPDDAGLSVGPGSARSGSGVGQMVDVRWPTARSLAGAGRRSVLRRRGRPRRGRLPLAAR